MSDQKLTTVVKLLNGDLFELEHYKDQLKEAIEHKIPELYKECQVLCYPEEDNKEFVLVMADTVSNAIRVDLQYVTHFYMHDRSDTFYGKVVPTKCAKMLVHWHSIHDLDRRKYSYHLPIMCHPKKGLAIFNYNYGSDQTWFATFRDLVSSLDDKPSIWASEDFVDKLEQELVELKSQNSII